MVMMEITFKEGTNVNEHKLNINHKSWTFDKNNKSRQEMFLLLAFHKTLNKASFSEVLSSLLWEMDIK